MDDTKTAVPNPDEPAIEFDELAADTIAGIYDRMYPPRRPGWVDVAQMAEKWGVSVNAAGARLMRLAERGKLEKELVYDEERKREILVYRAR